MIGRNHHGRKGDKSIVLVTSSIDAQMLGVSQIQLWATELSTKHTSDSKGAASLPPEQAQKELQGPQHFLN